jgi:N-acetylglucosamine kinase-like BadF-type ATPase
MRYAVVMAARGAVLGIDAGGTKTVCQVTGGDGQLLAESRGPGANLQNAGELQAEKILHEVIRAATLEADAWPVTACIGMAGVDRPEDAATVRGILSRLVPRCPVVVVNDALIALEAGVPGGPGVVLIAGTGSIAYGRNMQGVAARAGGWGYVLGDEGSGYWLGRQALRAVLRASDGRGPQTRLTAHVLAHYDVARPEDLVREIYYGRFKPSTVAAIASLVDDAATDGDVWAQQLIDTGARELSLAALAVCDRLALPTGPVVLAGGIFGAVPRMRTGVVDTLAAHRPGMLVQVLAREPAAGAISLAIAAADGTLVIPTYAD